MGITAGSGYMNDCCSPLLPKWKLSKKKSVLDSREFVFSLFLNLFNILVGALHTACCCGPVGLPKINDNSGTMPWLVFYSQNSQFVHRLMQFRITFCLIKLIQLQKPNIEV